MSVMNAIQLHSSAAKSRPQGAQGMRQQEPGAAGARAPRLRRGARAGAARQQGGTEGAEALQAQPGPGPPPRPQAVALRR